MFMDNSVVRANGPCTKRITIGKKSIRMRRYVYNRFLELYEMFEIESHERRLFNRIYIASNNINVYPLYKARRIRRCLVSVNNVNDKINNDENINFIEDIMQDCNLKGAIYMQKRSNRRRKSRLPSLVNQLNEVNEILKISYNKKLVNKQLDLEIDIEEIQESLDSNQDYIYYLEELYKIIRKMNNKNMDIDSVEKIYLRKDMGIMEEAFRFLFSCNYKVGDLIEKFRIANKNYEDLAGSLYRLKYEESKMVCSPEEGSGSGEIEQEQEQERERELLIPQKSNILEPVLEIAIIDDFVEYFVKQGASVESLTMNTLNTWLACGSGNFYRNIFQGSNILENNPFYLTPYENRKKLYILKSFVFENPRTLYSSLCGNCIRSSFYRKKKSYDTYYLNYEFDVVNTMKLGNRAPFFVTDQFSGCGFQVYTLGNGPYVSHINAEGYEKQGSDEDMRNQNIPLMSNVFDGLIFRTQEKNGFQNINIIRQNKIVRVFSSVLSQGVWKESKCELYDSYGKEKYECKVYNYYYGDKCYILGEKKGDQWYIYAIINVEKTRLSLKGRRKEKKYIKQQIWPVPFGI